MDYDFHVDLKDLVQRVVERHLRAEIRLAELRSEARELSGEWLVISRGENTREELLAELEGFRDSGDHPAISSLKVEDTKEIRALLRQAWSGFQFRLSADPSFIEIKFAESKTGSKNGSEE